MTESRVRPDDPTTDSSPVDESSDPVDEPFAPGPETTLFASVPALVLTPETSPDGAWLAYLFPDKSGTLGVWLSPTDGGAAIPVEVPFTPVVERDPDTGRFGRGPQWSPDGRTIALTGPRTDSRETGIWLVPVSLEAGPTVAVDAPVETLAAATDTLPDDDADATAETTAAAEPAMPIESAPLLPEPALDLTEPSLLTAGPGSDRSPRWSADGATIAFVATRDRRDAIAFAGVSGDLPGRTELLTWGPADDREPVWSRDGKFLAFTRQRGDGPDHADILVFVPAIGEVKNLTVDKASTMRHSLEWVPGRNLIAYVTIEGDWRSISVINADNKAGWSVTRESGDKTEPRFAPNEARMLYLRTEGFSVVLCERGLHASGGVALDPGEGVASHPRWIGPKRVVYGFSAPQRPASLLVQDNVATAERSSLAVPRELSTVGADLRSPIPFEFDIGEDEQFSGMIYRTTGAAGQVPAAVYLADGPLATRGGEFQIEEQALASSGITVLAPVIHGAQGFGQAVENDLAEYADTEIEIADIAEAGMALGDADGVDPARLALVGCGYGGALALVAAAARPGIYAAVVAIDPIADWAIELADAETPWRNWIVRQYGMPRTHADRYALRTAETFAAVLDVPTTIVTTAHASAARRAQVDAFVAYLTEAGVAFTHLETGEEPVAAVLQRVSRDLARELLDGRETVDVVEGVRADDLD